MVEIIAEVGSVHDGSLGNALKLIELAKELGADTVKFQTHIAAAETTKNAPMPQYFKGEPRYEYFERTGFNENQWAEIISCCAANEINFLSSPFSLEAFRLLEKLGVERFKIASGEVTNVPLIQTIADKGYFIYLSSGMSTWDELSVAIEACNADKLNVMQCSSIYPCPPEQIGLNVIDEIKKRFMVDVGFSDHSLGYASCLAAVTLGATCIEKHLTFSRKMYGSDASLAMEPNEFAILVKEIRFLEKALDHPVSKGSSFDYRGMKNIFEKSIVAASDIKAGAVINEKDLALKKPGGGIAPVELHSIVGRIAKNQIYQDQQLTWDDLSDD